jgi:hypothetical protein
MQRAFLIAACAATFAASACAQQASYSYFGAAGNVGCSPVGTPVTHTATNLPRIGTTFTVEVPASNGDCGYLCNLRLFATGLSDTAFQGVPLPVSTPGSCGQLRISLDTIALMPIALSSGATISNSLILPNAVGLVGMDFYQQSVSLTYIFGALNGVAWGRAGHGTIGN